MHHKFIILSFIPNWSTHITYIRCDAVNTKAVMLEPVMFWSHICTCISKSNINLIWIKQQFCYIKFSINNMKEMFLPHGGPLTLSSRERERERERALYLMLFLCLSESEIWKQSEEEGERNYNVILNFTLTLGCAIWRFLIVDDKNVSTICRSGAAVCM